jgi:hypothetical protein
MAFFTSPRGGTGVGPKPPILNFFTSIPEFCLDSNAPSARTVRESSPFYILYSRRCVPARASAFVCGCLLTILAIGVVRSEETSDQVPASAAAAESSTSPAEQSVPPAAAAKPVVERSRREVCDTLVQSAQSNALPIPFFIRLLLQESGFRPDVVSRAVTAVSGMNCAIPCTSLCRRCLLTLALCDLPSCHLTF